MEINNPGGDQNSLWYVTNGLLTEELITGRMSTGNTSFEQHDPAQINVTGDPSDVNAPTYASFKSLLGLPPFPAGTVLTQTLDHTGNVSANSTLSGYNVTAATFVPEKNHTVASVFWDFMNSSGLVFEGGERTAPLFQNPFYATGFPITEAYWTQVKVGGAPKWVLVQVFERRVLTYTPDNPDGWKVEAGNVGQHYYRWRYGQLGKTVVTVPEFSPFAQLWWRHGLWLSVDRSGHGTMTFRVYKWCSDDPTPPCDSISGNQIMNGGHAELLFTRVDGPTAIGNVISSNFSGVFAAGSVSLTLQQYDMAALSQGQYTIQLCGPNFVHVAPPSVIQTYPCGG